MAARNFDEVALILHPSDNVAVLKQAVAPGDELRNSNVGLPITEKIGAGHKIALHDIAAADPVRKYGQFIGQASQPIAAGAHVHTHNLVIQGARRDESFSTDVRPVD